MQSQVKNNFNNLKIVKAETFLQRFLGFMLKRECNYAILFTKCHCVHTFFMLFDLDIVFLDKDGKIVKIKEKVKPFRIVLPVKGAVDILEIPSNLNQIILPSSKP
jgi:uncharacterized membrane protein (UPF0127 family)